MHTGTDSLMEVQYQVEHTYENVEYDANEESSKEEEIYQVIEYVTNSLIDDPYKVESTYQNFGYDVDEPSLNEAENFQNIEYIDPEYGDPGEEVCKDFPI